MDRSKDSFCILKSTTDNEQYKLKILYLALYIPIAALSQNVFTEINSLLTSSAENKQVAIQYRNIQVRPITIPLNVHSFYSELLFTEDVPARLIVVFVLAESKGGCYTKNPFDFRRKWTVKKLETVKGHNSEDFEERLKLVEAKNEERLKQVELLNKKLLDSLQAIQEKLSTVVKGKGKGKGKGKTSSRPSTSASISQNMQNVTIDEQRSLQDQTTVQVSPSISLPNDFDDLRSTASTSSANAFQEEDLTDETYELYIKKIELLINGTPGTFP